MTLIAYQTNGCTTFTLKSRPCSRTVKLRHLVDLPLVRRSDKYTSLKDCFHCRVRPNIFPRPKHFKVYFFKGNDHGDVGRVSDEQVQLPLSPERGEEAETASAGSSSSAVAMSSLNGQTTQAMEGEIHRSSSDNMAKSFLMWFLSLDAALKIPLLIFIPWYVIIRATYGIDVARELMPLWTIGPIVTALYIKTIQAIISLYVFCFKKGAGVVENLPSYYIMISGFLMEGKLNEFFYVHLFKPIDDVKSADYKALGKHKFKQLREWAVEKYLDYVESIWPYYCRTIRFLKRANLL